MAAIAGAGGLSSVQGAQAAHFRPQVERLDVTVIEYDDFVQGGAVMIARLKGALLKEGIVGIRGVPGYRERLGAFIEAARRFAALEEAVKRQYAPKEDNYLGYELGAEKFKRPDGRWVPDDKKTSYYAMVPASNGNIWPREVALQLPFMELSGTMLETARSVVEKVGLVGPDRKMPLEGITGVGRMLHYRKAADTTADNPYWCGAHFDHGLFTALAPAFYFDGEEQVAEPEEAGLFVRAAGEEGFKKVDAGRDDVMLFQMGEFGQLAADDAMQATEHRVHKADGNIERHTLAVFLSPPFDTVIRSESSLRFDSRYGEEKEVSFKDWHLRSLERYRNV